MDHDENLDDDNNLFNDLDLHSNPMKDNPFNQLVLRIMSVIIRR